MINLQNILILFFTFTVLSLLTFTFIYLSSLYLPLPFINACYSAIGKDAFSYNVLKDCYSKDKSSAYYRSVNISDSDQKSFIVISNDYAKDKHNVYFRGKEIPEADPESFDCPKWDDTYLPFCDKTPSPLCTDFCSDINYKFKNDKVME